MGILCHLQLALIGAAAGAGIVVAGLSVVFFAAEYGKNDKKRAKKKKDGVIGLYNLGNTCFANSLLQCLASCPRFEVWLENVLTRLPSEKTPLLSEIRAVISSLSQPLRDDGPSSGEGVLRALHAYHWNITHDTEQDIFELFNVIVSTLDEELTPFRDGKMFTLSDVVALEKSSFGASDVEYLGLISEIVRDQYQQRPPCAGLLGTEISCGNCGYKKVRHDRFCSLDLGLPKTTKIAEISIESCLRRYFAFEILHNYTCDRCQSNYDRLPALSVRRASIMKKGISKLPDCLILRIERVGISPNGYPFKYIDHVKFSERLRLNELLFYGNTIYNSTKCSTTYWAMKGGGDGLPARVPGKIDYDFIVDTNASTDRYMYSLCAVVVHIGMPESGHFVTYRRSSTPSLRRPDQWFYISDTEVKRVSFEEAMASFLRSITNRNPRNLEKMCISRKPTGYHFENDRAMRQFYYQIEFEKTNHHTSAFLKHVKEGRVVQASTKEDAISGRLHSNTDVSASYNVGTILARRCLQAGIHFAQRGVTEEEIGRSERTQAFYRGVEDGGVVLNELPFMEPSYDVDHKYVTVYPPIDKSKQFESVP